MMFSECQDQYCGRVATCFGDQTPKKLELNLFSLRNYSVLNKAYQNGEICVVGVTGWFEQLGCVWMLRKLEKSIINYQKVHFWCFGQDFP